MLKKIGNFKGLSFIIAIIALVIGGNTAFAQCASGSCGKTTIVFTQPSMTWQTVMWQRPKQLPMPKTTPPATPTTSTATVVLLPTMVHSAYLFPAREARVNARMARRNGMTVVMPGACAGGCK
jgi:hypothetical protein